MSNSIIYSLPTGDYGRPRDPAAANAIALPSGWHVGQVRRAYRRARVAGLSRWDARRLVWDILFVTHCAQGGEWVENAGDGVIALVWAGFGAYCAGAMYALRHLVAS